MPAEVRIPTLGESVSEGVIVRWMKQDGEPVKTDEPVLELETDKANVEIPASAAGVLKILKQQGATVQVGEVVATIDGAATKPASQTSNPPTAESPKPSSPQTLKPSSPQAPTPPLSPAVRRLVDEHQLEPQAIQASGKGGRLTKSDVLAHVEDAAAAPQKSPSPTPSPVVAPGAAASISSEEERVPMTNLRKRIAERLVQAQHTAAILTTFNEIDMSGVMALRAQHKERFKQTHGVGLGFMSFFAKACIAALREVPNLNAFVDGTDIVFHNHVHLGIAVGTERGLVVPVVHHADQMTFAQVEKEIERLAGLARDAKLGIGDLSGGTFTITNGGVYGSLMSTPILNPPQSGILGMHKIEKRPVVVNDAVVIRPMMYVAVSYDHRLVDGEQAVTFLVKVKERIEDPARLLLEV